METARRKREGNAEKDGGGAREELCAASVVNVFRFIFV
jgi:hypothetical protein